MIVAVDTATLASAIFDVLSTQLAAARADDSPVVLAYVGADKSTHALTSDRVKKVLAAMANNVAQLVILGALEECATCAGTGRGRNGPCTACRGHGDDRLAREFSSEEPTTERP